MWDAMSSWFTPTTLFLLLNATIATIFVTSGFGSHKPPLTKTDLPQQESQSQSQTEPMLLQRSPSVLQRLKSFNFYQYANSYKPHEAAAPSSYEAPIEPSQMSADEYEAEDRFDHEDEAEHDSSSIEEVYSNLQQHGSNFSRTKSDTEPASGTVPVKLVKKMKKSASSKSAFRHFSEAEVLEARRPATAREAKAAAAEEDEDVEVDSKADDFINKFKQQLKLQRLNSILRYKEMLGRGAAQ